VGTPDVDLETSADYFRAPMAAKDLGTKFICFKCTTKFYDMKKPDPVCPKCGTDQRENAQTKPAEKGRGRLAAVPRVVEPVEPIAPAEASEEAEEEDIDSIEEEEPAVEDEDV
jgi:uncharacterized protein (TIGR02300 family)